MINYNAQDEQLFQSVSNLIAGDMNSYYTMYDLSVKYIYKIIYDIVKDYHTTEDLVQETYITIYNKINTLQDPRKFYPWAGRIATNHTLRYIQSNRRELLVFDGEDGEGDFIFDLASQDNEEFIPESILMDMEKQRLIAEIIDGLSVEQKLAVQYFYYEEMSVNEIAGLMGCSGGTVKSRLNYARKAIKNAVVDLDINENTRLYSLNAIPLFFIVFKATVEQFSFATPVAVGAEAASMGQGVAAGTGVAGAAGEGIGAGVAGAMGEGVGIASSAGTTMGISAGSAVASGVGKGVLAKFGASLGAKIAAGVVATGLVITGGVALHNVFTDDKDTVIEATEDTFDTTEVEDNTSTVEEVTEQEETTEASTTEETTEEITVSEEELVALNTMAINLAEALPGQELSGEAAIDDATVWNFIGRMNNNAQGGIGAEYMPESVGMNVYSMEKIKKYATDVFGIVDLQYVNNYWFSNQGDGTFYLTAAQMGNLDKCVLKNISIGEKYYTVVGTVFFGEIWDINQTEPSYSHENTFEFTMIVEKSAESPFGFKLVGISYEPGDVFDIGITEPPVVTKEGEENEEDDTKETFPIEMSASAIDENTTDPTMLKYLEIIRNVCNKNIWADGSAVVSDPSVDLSENEYGVLDIDGDGRKELVISIKNTSNAEMILMIYDYNPETDKVTEQKSAYPRIDVYDNGTFVQRASHNHTYSLDVWPYTLYKYNAETDSYDAVASVAGWERQYYSDGFPDSSDADGDGMVYEVTTYKGGDMSATDGTIYMDAARYNEWRSQYFNPDAPVASYVAEPMVNVLN